MPTKYPPTDAPYITNEKLPQHRPLHMIAGLAAITEFATVEAHTSVLLTALAQGDPVPVAAIYSTLRQGMMQGRALTAVAKLILPTDDFALLKKLMKVVQSASDDRDILAHRVWFYDQALLDAVVLSDPAIFWRTDHAVKVGGGPGPTTLENVERIQSLMREACQIWTLSDLETARLKAVHGAIGLQAFTLMIKHDAGSSARQEERQKVLNVVSTASDAKWI